jgi:hypothetical protein
MKPMNKKHSTRHAEMLVPRWNRMKAERGVLDSHLQECADYILPRKNDVTRIQAQGNKRNVSLYDTTGEQSAELLAGALHGMLTNPASIWMEYTTGDQALDDRDDVRRWLHDATMTTHAVLNQSNFQTEVHEKYIDDTWAGTSCMAIEEDDEFFVRFSARHIAEYCIEENYKGFIDTVFRNFKWSLRKIVGRFGVDVLSKNLKELYVKEPDKEFTILHAVYPREREMIRGKKGTKNYPFASIHVLVEEKLDLDESGFREFPYAVSRWTKASGEKYGRSPGMKALPEVKMVNEMMLTTLRAAQKMVDPPLMVPDDGFLLPLKTQPAGINIRRSGNPDDRIEPFGNDCRIDFGYQVMEDVRKRIRECFYVDQLQLGTSGPQMTATEVLQRTEEKLKLMGPMLGRQQSEFLQPMIDRVFAILLRRKRIALPPPILSGKTIQVRYTSQLARAQRTSEGASISKAWAMLAPLAQLDPTIMDIFNADRVAKYVVQINGVPPNILADAQELKNARANRAQVQADQQKKADEMHGAEVASKALPGMAQMKQAEQQNGR